MKGRISVDDYKKLMSGESENKYKAKKTYCNQGHVHDSKKEALRCNELCILEKAGLIKNLEQQKSFLIIPALYKEILLDEVYKKGSKKGQRKKKKITEEQATYYKADFCYFDVRTGKNIIEDSKGKRTKDYILKRKLMKQKYCDENTVFYES